MTVDAKTPGDTRADAVEPDYELNEFTMGFLEHNCVPGAWCSVSSHSIFDGSFEPHRLVVPSTCAPKFEVQLPDGRIARASEFDENQRRKIFEGDPPNYRIKEVRKGDEVTLRVRNVTDTPARFQAAIIGRGERVKVKRP